MASSREIVDAARICLGTPFRHQGRIPGRGLDCIGLALFPAVHCGIVVDGFTEYGTDPDPQMMMRELARRCVRRDGPPEPSDIVWLMVGDDPKHVALYTHERTLIHAVSEGRGRVVEHAFRTPWTERVHAVFRYPGVL